MRTGFRIGHKTDIIYFIRCKLGYYRTVAPAHHFSLLGSNDKTGTVLIHATDNLRIFIHYIGNLIAYHKCHCTGGVTLRCRQRLETDFGTCVIRHTEGTVHPAVTAPLKTGEYRFNIIITPFLTVYITVGTPGGGQFQHHVIRRFRNLKVGLAHFKRKYILTGTAYHAALDNTGIHGTGLEFRADKGNTCRRYKVAAFIHFYRSWNLFRVICRINQCVVVILRNRNIRT